MNETNVGKTAQLEQEGKGYTLEVVSEKRLFEVTKENNFKRNTKFNRILKDKTTEAGIIYDTTTKKVGYVLLLPKDPGKGKSFLVKKGIVNPMCPVTVLLSVYS